jgi:radical SAM superfamily enzyme
LIYTDDEKSFSLPAIKTYFRENKINHYVTRHHAAFSERFIRTFKNMLYKRIDNDIKAEVYINPQWKDYIEEIMISYNFKNKHSSTGLTPDNARRVTNQLEVKTQLELNAMKTRKYPIIELNDKVKIYFKKKFQKERVSTFSKEIYKVVDISESLGQSYYKVEGNERSYLRFELLKV